MSIARKLWTGLLIGLVLVIILALLWLPQYLDKHLNTISNVNPLTVSERAKTLHSKLTIVDLHADALLFNRNLLAANTYGHIDIPRLRKGNVSIQAFTVVTKMPQSQDGLSYGNGFDKITPLAILERWPIATWWSLKQRALYQAQKLHDVARSSKGDFIVITTARDVTKFLSARRHNKALTAGFLGLEGAHALEADIDNVNLLYKAGFRMIAPVHFFSNELGGASQGTSARGLSEFGKKVVKRAEKLNMIIDLAHASPETIDDILDVATRPVVVSHTGAKGVNNNSRNLSDRQIKRIAEHGGLVGIGFWKTATGGSDAKSIAHSIRYVANLVGVKHMVLGSDFDGTTRVPFDVSQMNQLTEALIEEGFTEKEISMIMGGNAVRFLENYLPKN